MDILTLTLEDVENDVRGLSGGLELDLSLALESDCDSLLFTRLEFVLLWLHSEDFSGQLLLPGKVVSNWIFTLVLNGDLILFWFANSYCSEIKNLRLFLADCDSWRDFEGLGLNLDNSGLLVLGNTFTLCVLNFKSD